MAVEILPAVRVDRKVNGGIVELERVFNAARSQKDATPASIRQALVDYGISELLHRSMNAKEHRDRSKVDVMSWGEITVFASAIRRLRTETTI